MKAARTIHANVFIEKAVWDWVPVQEKWSAVSLEAAAAERRRAA